MRREGVGVEEWCGWGTVWIFLLLVLWFDLANSWEKGAWLWIETSDIKVDGKHWICLRYSLYLRHSIV